MVFFSAAKSVVRKQRRLKLALMMPRAALQRSGFQIKSEMVWKRSFVLHGFYSLISSETKRSCPHDNLPSLNLAERCQLIIVSIWARRFRPQSVLFNQSEWVARSVAFISGALLRKNMNYDLYMRYFWRFLFEFWSTLNTACKKRLQNRGTGIVIPL